MKTRVFRPARFALALALGSLAPAFVGCAADVGDTPDAWGSKPIILTPPKEVVPECQNPALACTTTCASTSAGTTCDKDCDTQCGFGSIGIKHCTCASGTFTSCYCVPPSDCTGPADPAVDTNAAYWFQCWRGASVAPRCSAFGAPTGKTSEIIGQPCAKRFDECVGTDPNTGTDRGCACMPQNKSQTVNIWVCGSTNRWFDLAQ